MKTLIKGGVLVNEGGMARGDILIADDLISSISKYEDTPDSSCLAADADAVVDATDCYVMPGVIDTHVHFREPGLTEKADMESESRAAAAGGVTSFLEMPNTVPQTTTPKALDEKFVLAARKSHVNYSFFFGATNDNAGLFARLDGRHIPGIKLFMGSSTGNMLVEGDTALERVFSECSRLHLPLMAHCEDTAIISRNMADACSRYGDDPPVRLHPLIRSEEACMASTAKAVRLARRHHTRLHVAHVSTAAELEMFAPYDTQITAEATVGHLLFTHADYERLGTRIKVNPAIKSDSDRQALLRGLTDGRIATVATDHAPHLLSQKEGGCRRAASGMPMVQFSLPAMLGLVDNGQLTLPWLVELMCHRPATLFGILQRGFLREGFKADLAIVRPRCPWTLTPDIIESRCQWSPLEGQTFQWRVEQTLCNGRTVYQYGTTARPYAGEALTFNHP